MRKRGEVYWKWASSELHFRNYDERLTCGTLINIQVRTSKENATQLFFGVYSEKGLMLLEEHYPDCRGQTMTAAMVWALKRAYDWVEHKFQPAEPPSAEPLPRNRSQCARE